LQFFEGLALKNYDSYGDWIGGCGKFFMFSATKVSAITSSQSLVKI
jgi:hypothetical protein